MQKIRERVADYMRSHIDDFLYFLSKADSDEPYTLGKSSYYFSNYRAFGTTWLF